MGEKKTAQVTMGSQGSQQGWRRDSDHKKQHSEGKIFKSALLWPNSALIDFSGNSEKPVLSAFVKIP